MSPEARIPVKLVVFDLAGTTVDFGCMAPVAAFITAFAKLGIKISTSDARGPMGLHKRDHIRELLKLKKVDDQWVKETGRSWTENDVEHIYSRFIPMQAQVVAKHSALVPGLLSCISSLRAAEIAMAVTTGYPRSVAEPVLAAAADQGFVPDFSICADEVNSGRPAPWMIYRCMESTGSFPAQCVAKIGDTRPDMEAAKNAGVVAIGVTRSSSLTGLTHAQFEALAAEERERLHQTVARHLVNAGADEVIGSVAELPELLFESISKHPLGS